MDLEGWLADDGRILAGHGHLPRRWLGGIGSGDPRRPLTGTL